MPRWLIYAVLAGIIGVALALRLIRLDHGGFLTPYYAVAVRSMAGNWHDFVFAAFDPPGFLAVDKPPVAFWVQVAAVKLLGFSPFAVRVPQVFEGVVAVGLLYHLVARRLGAGTGLLAALFLATSPLSVAVDRSNNTDSCLVLIMLVAAWPLAVATERARPGLLMLAAGLLGVAFNVKMLAAMVVAPAFITVYSVAAPASWRRRLAHLVGAGTVLGLVSLSWPMLSELTPTDERPYVDSTLENSVLELAVGHNALDRFVRPAWRRHFGAEESRAADAAPRAASPAGVLRLADPRLATQVLWLLPLAVAGVLLGLRRPRMLEVASSAGAAGRRASLPLDPVGQAIALWTVWAIVSAAVYSCADGIFQPYYLAPLAPAVAALAAFGVTRLRSAAATIAALLATGVWQSLLVWDTADFTNLLLCIGAVPLVGGLIASGILMGGRRLVGVATGIGVVVLLVAPVAWTAGTILRHGGGSPVAALTEQGTAVGMGGPAPALANNPRLLQFLADHRGGAKWLLVTPNARQAAAIMLPTGEPVMALGGFLGSVPILTTEEFARLAALGEIRFVLVGGGPPTEPGGDQPRMGREMRLLHDWVLAHGQEVPPEKWRSVAPSVTPGGARRWSDGPSTLQIYDLAPAHVAAS